MSGVDGGESDRRTWWQLAKTCSGTELDRRNYFVFVSWLTAWAATFLVATKLLQRDLYQTTPVSWVLVLVLLLSLPVPSSGQSLRDQIIENHFAYVPSDEGRFKTLIAMPGCSGISSDDLAAEQANTQLGEDDLLFRRHYRYVAEKFKTEGFVVLLVNIQAAEGLLTACADPIDGERMAEYIDETIAWASELPFVDADNIHLIGWSMGGSGVLKWLHGPRSEATSVRSAIAVYPSCSRHTTLTIPIPTLILLGG